MNDSLEKCDRCGVVGQDRRSLWMACFFKMSQLGIPFEVTGLYGGVLRPKGTENQWGAPEFHDPPFDRKDDESYGNRIFYTLRVCKGCRGEWMGSIQSWFRAKPGDVSRHNNDEKTDPDPDQLPALMSQAEKLRTELAALSQSTQGILEGLRSEETRREMTDRRSPPKESE